MTTPLRSICVFCGASRGAHPLYAEAAIAMGRTLAERGIRMIYGGGRIGLMGAAADGALAAGGDVHGVIPGALLKRELGHPGVASLDVVGSMHERKARMAELSDAFIALPGGAGTLEEIAEIWTWAQLGLHNKPIGFLNVAGYYDSLFAFVDHAVAEAFITPANARMLTSAGRPAQLIDALTAYVPPVVTPWIEPDDT
jgi:uncharacterized protein (TIGR00730 family)